MMDAREIQGSMKVKSKVKYINNGKRKIFSFEIEPKHFYLLFRLRNSVESSHENIIRHLYIIRKECLPTVFVYKH